MEPQTQIKIIVSGGCVASVYATDANLKMTVLDTDNCDDEVEQERIDGEVDSLQTDPKFVELELS